MKISLDWLSQYIDIDAPVEEIADKLTQSGLEVEGLETFETLPGGLRGLVIGEVTSCEKHPDADRLSKTTVNVGEEEDLPIVCGAPNVAKGQKVVVATVGAMLYPGEGEPFKIKKGKIRGEVSLGMICAEDEISLGNSHDGIMVLDTDLPNGTPAAEYFGVKEDKVIEIGLTPNRADAASHYGVARELKALYGAELKLPEVGNISPENTSGNIPVIVENVEAAPRYCGLTIDGLTVKDSPKWLQDHLKAIGLQPINNVVDATNYILHGLGQPLHAFDTDKIGGRKIKVKTLPEGTPFTTLDEVERKLKAEDLMICDGNDTPMCIAGVFGGLESGVTETTKSIFLESAYFSPDYVRKSSLVHGLKTDASFRFERGTDPDMPPVALKIAAKLIQEVAGGEITSEITDLYGKKIEPFEVEVSYKNIHRLAGAEIPEEEINSILKSLEIEIKAENEGKLLLSVPPYRVDVQREADIVEDIIRIYGYDNIGTQEFMGAEFLAPVAKNDHGKRKASLGHLLASQGFHEIITNSLTKPEYTEGIDGFKAEENVDILNKLSEDLGIMRRTLLFQGLEVIAHNINRKQPNLKLFEFGKSYKKTEEGYQEQEHLALFVSGNKFDESWLAKSEGVAFSDLATPALAVLEKLGIKGYNSVKTSNPLFTEGLDLVLNEKVIASLGLVKKSLTKKAGVKASVFFADFNTDILFNKKQKPLVYKEISKFPEVRRDLSLVLSSKVNFQEIQELAKKTERKLLQSINVFDTFEGEQLGEGKKSYSVSFFLQDPNKTLDDKVIDKTMNRLMDAFEKELGAEIKGR